MSWNRNSLHRAAAAAIVAGALAGPVAHAATIVVRANGPSAGAYPPGRTLQAGAIITLHPGDAITVLDASGTRVLRGPGRVPVSGTGVASINGIAALIADTGVRQTRTGATRGVPSIAPHPTNLWYADVTKGGNFCLADPKALALWRPDSTVSAEITLTGSAAAPVVLDLRPGQAVAAWPLAALPISDGASYRIADGASGSHVTITIRMLPGGSPSSLDTAAQGLLEHGCTGQVDTIVAATSTEPGA